MLKDFETRAYSKKELALSYFPQSENPRSAVNRLMAWINRCTPLRRALEEQGYQKSAKWFNPREVRLIVSHLGEP